MAADLVISKIRKNASSEIRVILKEYKGKHSCDIREYYLNPDSSEWVPTTKGVSIPLDMLGEAVDAAEALAEKDQVCEVSSLSCGKTAMIRFGICEFNKRIYGEVRKYYKKNEDVLPGKGATLPLSKLGELAKALRLAEDEAKRWAKT